MLGFASDYAWNAEAIIPMIFSIRQMSGLLPCYSLRCRSESELLAREDFGYPVPPPGSCDLPGHLGSAMAALSRRSCLYRPRRLLQLDPGLSISM